MRTSRRCTRRRSGGRLVQFGMRAPIWLTRAPTFAEKARLFPNAVFAVGADTAERILQPRFYQDSAERMLAALDEVRQHGCRFLVAGRVDREGKFLGLEDLAIPDQVRRSIPGHTSQSSFGWTSPQRNYVCRREERALEALEIKKKSCSVSGDTL